MRIHALRFGWALVRWRALFAVAAAAILTLAATGSASGQARLLSSFPGDGDALSNIEEISFEFDSLLDPTGAAVTITKLDGTTFEVEKIHVDGEWLSGENSEELPSGRYEIAYSVRSSDGSLNEGAIQVSIDAPSQALSGGLLAVMGIFGGLCVYLGIVFRADKRRRPTR